MILEIIIIICILYLLTAPVVIGLVCLASDFLDKDTRLYKFIKLLAKIYAFGIG